MNPENQKRGGVKSLVAHANKAPSRGPDMQVHDRRFLGLSSGLKGLRIPKADLLSINHYAFRKFSYLLSFALGFFFFKLPTTWPTCVYASLRLPIRSREELVPRLPRTPSTAYRVLAGAPTSYLRHE